MDPSPSRAAECIVLVPFIDRFVLPLLRGGDVRISGPIRPRDLVGMVVEQGLVPLPELEFARYRRASLLSPDPPLDPPDSDELALWAGLYNALCLDHPERSRVWSRPAAWGRVENSSRVMLALPQAIEVPEALARHLTVDAFLQLRRVDTIVHTGTGEVRFLGQEVPRRRFNLGPVDSGPRRREAVGWLGQPHTPELSRLVEDAMRASPLTCLLRPQHAPPDWSPLLSSSFLKTRGFARTICHRWASDREWIAIGGAVSSALIRSITRTEPEPPSDSQAASVPALTGVVVPVRPEDIGAVVGSLIHLHFLKVLEYEARIGVAAGSRDPGVMQFLALPLLLPSLSEVLGNPLSGVVVPPRGSGNRTESFEAQACRRWTEYLDHLHELVPRRIVENLLASLVPAIVPTS